MIEGESGLVTATMSPISVRAGVEALRQGGNASDAAATVALTQIATALGSYVSYAGILQLVYYDAKSGKVYSMNAGWNSYLGESDPKTIPVANLEPLPIARPQTAGREGRKTLVPGFMAGIDAMHKRFGRLPFATLFQPAIAYAENGVTVSPMLAGLFPLRGKYLTRTAEGRAFLNQAGDAVPKAGDRFVQADLAKTLRAVAKHGSRYMYTGAWGQQFVEAVRREGGKATLEDMRRYQPTWEEPLNTTFQGHTVYVPGKSDASAYRVLEALNLAEAMQLDQMGPYYKDVKALRTLSEILRVATYDGLPQLTEWKRQKGLSLLPGDRITKPYASALASVLGEVREQEHPEDTHHSDAIVVVDRWGNIASMVHSINTAPWGTTGIVVGGIPVSDVAGTQQSQLAALKPGDRLPMEAAPVIVMTGAKPTLALGTVGMSLIPETVRLLVGTLMNHLDPQTLMAAPPMLADFELRKEGETFAQRALLIPDGAYDPEFLKSLQAAGVKMEQKSKQEVYLIKGTAVLGTIDLQGGAVRSVETPGVFGFAAAD